MLSLIPTQVTSHSSSFWPSFETDELLYSIVESKQVIIEGLRQRDQNFLNLVKKGIYENQKSPYLKLLKVAGCEFGDIELLVRQNGLEPTLNKLLAAGVYIGWEEFKGKREVVRGGQHFHFREADFDNPYLAGYYHVRSRLTSLSYTVPSNKSVSL